MTVFIVQEMRGRDITDTVRRMIRKLSKFTDDDYLLLAGDPAGIAIASALAAQHNMGRFKVLKWDRLEQRYYPLEVNLNP